MSYYIAPIPSLQIESSDVFIPDTIILPLGIMPPPGLNHPEGYLEIVRPIYNNMILPSGSTISNEYNIKISLGFTIIKKNTYEQNLAILHHQIGMVTSDFLIKHIEMFDLKQLLQFINRDNSLEEIQHIVVNSVELEIIVRLIIISYFEWLNLGGKFKMILFDNLSKYANLVEKMRDIISICVIFKILKY